MSFSAPQTSPDMSSSSRAPSLVVIGNFDGVHRGHLHVLQRAAELSAEEGLKLKVLTFHPHPRQVITGETVYVLTTIDRKCGLLEQMGLGLETVVLPFTLQTAQLSPAQFVQSILHDQLAASVVMVGQNFRFGRARSGDLATLIELGRPLQMRALAETLQGDAEGIFSSTRVRAHLHVGDVERATTVLGRPHLLSGAVIQGDQRGRTLGFPTANLDKVAQVLPCDGVYAAHVYDLSNSARYLGAGALNLGIRPTVGRPHAIEVHVIDFNEDLYGRQLAVELVAQVREVRKFDNVSALKAQIATDIEVSRRLLSTVQPSTVAPGFL